MVNYELLNEKIKASGLKLYAIADACGLTRQGFHNKISGEREFSHSEIVALCDVLRLTPKEREKIFFN